MGSCYGDQNASITIQLVKQKAKWADIEDGDLNTSITTHIKMSKTSKSHNYVTFSQYSLKI